MVRAMTRRLSKQAWLRHGLLTLAGEGHNGLKVGPMATGLNVSRGSFYWHFADIADFRTQLLAAWQDATTDQVIRDLDARATGPGGLKLLLQRTMRPGRSLERAVRAWAAEDPEAAAAITAMDARRLARVETLLTDAGVPADRAPARAAFLYWAYLGQSVVMDPRHNTIPPEALDDIAALFEG
jgi:AcrR family transcriptional regulator